VPALGRELRSFLDLLALCGFAIAQPLLGLFGGAPQHFAFRGATGADIVAFAFGAVLLPPLLLWAGEAAVGLVLPRARRVVHLALVGALVAVFVVQLARPLGRGIPLFLLAVVVAGLAVALLARWPAARLWLRYAAVAPVAFLALFLLGSPASRLIGSEATAAEVEVGAPAPVVVLVFDELPLTSVIRSDGTLDEELFPNLVELAAGSHWFRNATTVSGSTWHAAPAIATGRLPRSEAAPIAADHPESLFTLLGEGYGLNVVESVSRLCPSDLCGVEALGGGGRRELLRDAARVMRARLSLRGPSGDPVAGLVEAPVAGAAAEEDGFADFGLNQPDRFRGFLDGITADEAGLHYLHILLPHVPYRYLPSGAVYESPDPDLGRVGDDWAPEPWLTTLARQRHLLQVAYVDRLLGELVDTLRQRGVYDDALVILTSDHGIAFEPGGPIRGLEGQDLDDRTLSDLLWVPLIVKEPHQRQGEVNDDDVTTLDVVPTIADVLDVDLPWSVDGRSVLGPPRPPGPKVLLGSEVNPFGVEVTGPIEVDPDAGWQRVLDNGVDRFLPTGGGADRLHRVGPAPDLVGTAVGEAGGLEPLTAELHDPARFADVDPGGGTVPALVRGHVEGAVGAPLAVAVNGVVAATAPAYDDGGRAAFAVVVGDRWFRPGANEVTVHRIAS
jgi:hypothetical protein